MMIKRIRDLNEVNDDLIKLYDEYEDYIDEDNAEKINLETHLKVKNEQSSVKTVKIIYSKSSILQKNKVFLCNLFLLNLFRIY